MPEMIYISTAVGERLNYVLSVVGSNLVKVWEPLTENDTTSLIQIAATCDEWNVIKNRLLTTK